MAGRHHVGTVDPAEVDGPLQGDIEQQPARLHEQPQVAHGREPRPQRAPGVGDGAQRPHGRVVLHRVQRTLVVRPAEEEIHLHVHQPGEQREVAEVDHHGVGRNRRRRYVDDAVAVDQHVAGLEELALVHVEQPSAAQVDHCDKPTLQY